MKYFQVDVFASAPLSGNGLAVLLPEKPLKSGDMLGIAREFYQFESVFIFPRNKEGAFPARIFTVTEELPFAGHPALGAAAVLHRVIFSEKERADISLALSGRLVKIESLFTGGPYRETMNQGEAAFLGRADGRYVKAAAEAIGLEEKDLDAKLPLEVVSTGLPYLLVPVRDGIGRARIAGDRFEEFLAAFGARFVYVFDPDTLECRTWDNTGRTEDVATGSAAGPLCAYLVRHGLKKEGEIIPISQGRFAGRPSRIEGWVQDGKAFVRGGVAFFAAGECVL